MQHRWGWALVLVVVAVAVGCGDDSATQASGRARIDPTTLTIHPILSTTPGPCATSSTSTVLPSPDDPTTCMTLGPAGFDATGVAKASLGWDGGSELAVDLELTHDGQRRLDRLAAAHLYEQLAIVADGHILSAPNMQSPGPYPVVSIGGISRDEATRLVRRLGGDATIPATTTTSAPSADKLEAQRACRQYAATHGITISSDAGMKDSSTGANFSAVPLTVGLLKKGVVALPDPVADTWAQLPDDHVVYDCTFDLPPIPTEIPSTTTCPDGSTVESDLKVTDVLIDLEGRTSEGFLGAMSKSTCG